MRPFEISIPTTSVNLGPAGATTVTFSVSNSSGRALRANFVLLPDDPRFASWLRLTVPPSYDFTKESALTQVGVAIAAPSGAPPGTTTFKLRAMSAERPDDDFTDSPTVAFVVGPSEVRAPFPWWAIVTALAIVLIAGGAFAFLHARTSGPAGRLIYIANRAGNILAFAVGSNGNVPPSINIAGPTTGLVDPVGFAVSPSGSLYVANDSGKSVLFFSADANGNLAPAGTIGGSNSDLGPTEGLAFDASGNLYVGSYTGQPRVDVEVFAPGASGNATPIRIIAGPTTQFVSPRGLAVDSTGRLYVADATATILVFAPGASGDVAPAATLGGPTTGITRADAIAVDRSDRIYVPDANGSAVRVFAAGASGDTAPIATLAGPHTTLSGIGTIGLDAAGYLYVMNGGANSTMLVFAPGASGDTAPIATIGGSTTLLDDGFYPTIR